MEDAVPLIPTFPAGKCGAGRGAEARVAPRQAQDSTVSQKLPAQQLLVLLLLLLQSCLSVCLSQIITTINVVTCNHA